MGTTAVKALVLLGTVGGLATGLIISCCLGNGDYPCAGRPLDILPKIRIEERVHFVFRRTNECERGHI